MGFRWLNYIDLKITIIRAQFGNRTLDGVCGNLNCNPNDDTTIAIMERVGVRVAPSENMFNHQAKADLTPEMMAMLDKDCDASTRTIAESTCRGDLPGAPTPMFLSCVYDMCFGHLSHAQRIA